MGCNWNAVAEGINIMTEKILLKRNKKEIKRNIKIPKAYVLQLLESVVFCRGDWLLPVISLIRVTVFVEWPVRAT